MSQVTTERVKQVTRCGRAIPTTTGGGTRVGCRGKWGRTERPALCCVHSGDCPHGCRPGLVREAVGSR